MSAAAPRAKVLTAEEYLAQMDAADRAKQRAAVADVFDTITKAVRQPTEDTRDKFNVATCEDLEQQPDLDYIVKGVLLRTDIAALLGVPSAGKSAFALDIAAAVTRGVEWHGRRVSKGRVVYVLAEGAAGFKGRVKAYRKVNNVAVADMPEFIRDVPNLKTEADARLIGKKIGKADVIVVDTFPASFVGNENSGEDVGPAIANCKILHDITGALVLLLCHPGKDLSKGLRGWSGMLGALDTLIEIERTGDYRGVTVVKQKDGAEGPLLGFTLQMVDVGQDRDGDTIHSVVLVPASEPTKKTASGGKTRSGVYVDAVRKHVRVSGKHEFDVKELTVKVAATLPKTGGKDRRLTETGRAIGHLIGDFFEVVPNSDGERVRMLGPVVDNNPEAWLE